MSFFDLARTPDLVKAVTEAGVVPLEETAGTWRGSVDGGGIEVGCADGDTRRISLRAPGAAVLRLQLRWRADVPANMHYLADHWERGYGDLAWRTLVPERPMPWYFLAHDGEVTHAYGVMTQANSLCCWQVDDRGISLWIDVACGGTGVRLGERELHACTVISRRGLPGESASAAAHHFAKRMCPSPRMPASPAYGANDWYYAYGKNTAEGILRDAHTLVELSPGGANRPFQVIDAGWSKHNKTGCDGGPWNLGNANFPDMPGLAASMRALGVRPGIWCRPLLYEEDLPASLLLPRNRFPVHERSHLLDPTVPAALERIGDDIRRFREWGYELVKHDFSTWDILGRWGFAMGFEVTDPGWHFADRSRTTAEAVLALYRTIREAAGDMAIIGCNTIGHLAAGLVELNRTGDDTSGKSWERTRKMGVNTLAFRAHQHGAFFAVDADCVGLTTKVPWELNRQWLDLLARSGTPLFVSADPEALGADQRAALKEAFAFAAEPRALAEPLDWMYSTAPSYWRFGDESAHYDWYREDGVRILDHKL